jgi:hypothetical protein
LKSVCSLLFPVKGRGGRCRRGQLSLADEAMRSRGQLSQLPLPTLPFGRARQGQGPTEKFRIFPKIEGLPWGARPFRFPQSRALASKGIRLQPFPTYLLGKTQHGFSKMFLVLLLIAITVMLMFVVGLCCALVSALVSALSFVPAFVWTVVLTIAFLTPVVAIARNVDWSPVSLIAIAVPISLTLLVVLPTEWRLFTSRNRG